MITQSLLNLIFPLVKKSTNFEKRINSDLKLLKNEKTTYKNTKLLRSRPGILYGLGKVHKETKNEVLTLHPVLSANGTSTYKLVKFLLPFLTLLNEK